MEELIIQPMDDIQLSIYLAQKNYPGQPAIHIKDFADSIHQWIKDKRDEQLKSKRNEN